MRDEEGNAETGADETKTGPARGGKMNRAGGDKSRRSHGERAMANIRAARKGQREVSEPVERAQFLLAEANVLALLELADAIGGGSRPEESSPSD
jgi:hypothetical protein